MTDHGNPETCREYCSCVETDLCETVVVLSSDGLNSFLICIPVAGTPVGQVAPGETAGGPSSMGLVSPLSFNAD